MNKSFSYLDFVAANSDKKVFVTDYLQIIYRLNELPNDFISSFSKFFWPDILIKDNKAFLSEVYEQKKFYDLRSRCEDIKEVQMWMNLIEITGLFDQLNIDDALSVSERMVKCWNSRLLDLQKPDIGRARLIHDEDVGEIFITID